MIYLRRQNMAAAAAVVVLLATWMKPVELFSLLPTKAAGL